MFLSILPLCLIRLVPRLGGSHPQVRSPGPILDPLHTHSPFRLLTGLESPGHHAHQPGANVHLQSQLRPLQVGCQSHGGQLQGRRRLGVRGRHKSERGRGEARRWHRVSARPCGVEGLPDSGPGVWRLWRGNNQVLIHQLETYCLSICSYYLYNSFNVVNGSLLNL